MARSSTSSSSLALGVALSTLVVFFALLLCGGAPTVEGAVTTSKLRGYPDLPSPLARFKTMAAGSYVIAMDDRQNSGGIFNLRAYGLGVHLLYNNVPVYWAIRSGKTKDQADFTANAHLTTQGSASSAPVSFAGGPLVIPASYAANVTSVLAKFTDVVVYILDEAVTIDVRHILITRPKAIISNLSTYASTLTKVFTAAGLVDGTHFVAVNQTASSAVVSSLDATSCYTMFAEPHYVFDITAPAYLTSVQNFVNSGGNFFAQCAAINSYENRGTGGSGFMSQYGITTSSSTNQNLVFPYADLPFSQVVGSIDGSCSGATPEFSLNAPLGFLGSYPASEDGWWQPNAYPHVYNNASSVTTLTGGKMYISSATKVTDDITGGMVFFMGAHEYTSSTQIMANGRRMFLNAYLTPANRPSTCGFEFCPSGETCAAGPCQSCVCVNNQKVITNATCCTNGVPVTCPSATPSTSPTPSTSFSPTPSTSFSPTPSTSFSPTPSTSFSPTPSISLSPTPSISLSPTPSTSFSPTPSISLSPTPSTSFSPTPSTSFSPTPSTSFSPTPSISLSPTPSTSLSPTPSTSLSPTPSTSLSPTPSISLSPTPSISLSPTPSTSFSPTPSTSLSPTPSTSFSPTPSTSFSPTPSTSFSPTPSTSLSPTPSTSFSPTPSTSLSPTPSTSFSPTPSTSFSPTPSTSFSPTPSTSLSPTPSTSFSPTPSTSLSPTPSTSFSPTPSASFSPTPSTSFSPTPSSSLSPTPSTTPTPSPSATPSVTPSSSPSPSPSETPSPSLSPSASPSASPSTTPTPSRTPSQTPSVTPSQTPSVTPSVAPSGSASPPSSVTPSPSPAAPGVPSADPSPSGTPSATPSVSPKSSGSDGGAAIGLAAGVGGGLALLAAASAFLGGLGLVAWRRRRAPGEEEIIRSFAPFFVEVANKGASQTLTTVDAAQTSAEV